MPKYAQLIYDGFWWSPERKALQALIDDTQEYVSGNVEISLYKGNVSILGRSSEFSLYDAKIVTFEDDENAYNQADATGFIKINSLRLKQIAKRKRKTNP
jgi:argininosuccinate synthase